MTKLSCFSCQEVKVSVVNLPTSDDPTPKKTNEHSNFLHVYFSIAYYLLIAPFRFQKGEGGEYKLRKWLPQQVLCGIVSISKIVHLGAAVHFSLGAIGRTNLVSFLGLFIEVSIFFFQLTFLYSLWRKSEQYLNLINYVGSNEFLLPYNPIKLESKLVISLLCAIGLTEGLLDFLFDYEFDKVVWSEWSPELKYNWIVAEARRTILLSNKTGILSPNPPPLEPISLPELMFTAGHGLLHLVHSLQAWLSVLHALFLVWTLWAPSSAFASSLRSSGNEIEMDLALKQYNALKVLSTFVEEIIGHNMLPYMAVTSFYYALSFGDLVLAEDGVRQVFLLLQYTSYFSILLFSAEIVRKMNWFRAWLFEQERWRLVEPNQFAVVLSELDHQSVGISAAGIFTITYSLVGIIMSTLLTYFIIRLQTTSN